MRIVQQVVRSRKITWPSIQWDMDPICYAYHRSYLPSGLMLPELSSSQASRSKAKAKGFIVNQASHKAITGNARRNRKLLVIQQVG